jgi:hypothetical protein
MVTQLLVGLERLAAQTRAGVLVALLAVALLTALLAVRA